MKIFRIIATVQERFKQDGKASCKLLGNFNIVFQISSTFDDFSEKRQNWGKNDYFTSIKNLLGNSTCAGGL